MTVFVYGSLLKGFWNHRLFASRLVACEPARVEGLRLAHLPEGYPAAFDGEPAQVVVGELHTFAQGRRALTALDELEEFDPRRPAASVYVRRRVRASVEGGSAEAWIYVYAWEGWEEALRRGAVEVASGDWRGFMARQ